MLRAANWGAVALGAMTGLFVGIVAFVVLGVVGVTGPTSNPIPLILVQFGALVVGGFVAGRFGHRAPMAHGGLAGIAMFLVIGIVSIAATAGPTTIELIILGLIAAILGSVGGGIARLLDDGA